MTLDLEQIKRHKRKPVLVEVPEWDGQVEVRTVTAEEFHKFREIAEGCQDKTDEQKTVELCVFLINKPNLDSEAGRQVLLGLPIKSLIKLQMDLIAASGLSIEDEKKS